MCCDTNIPFFIHFSFDSFIFGVFHPTMLWILCALTGFWYVVHTAHTHSLRYMSIWWCFILFDKALSIQNYRFIGLFVQTVENDFSLNLNFGLYFIYSFLLYATLFPIVSFYCFSLFRLLFMCLCAFFFIRVQSSHHTKIK